MLICSNCFSETNDGNTHCNNCGSTLTGGSKDETSIIERTPNIEAMIATARLKAAQAKSPDEPNMVALYIGQSPTPTLIKVDERITLGRRFETVTADVVDLNRYNAGDLGVSRQHATISFKMGKYYLSDIGSINGTWLNGQPIKPYEMYPLQPGAVILLGQLPITIQFKAK